VYTLYTNLSENCSFHKKAGESHHNSFVEVVDGKIKSEVTGYQENQRRYICIEDVKYMLVCEYNCDLQDTLWNIL